MACIYFPLTKHKSFEGQLEFFSDLSHDNILELSLNWTLHQDHAGPLFTFVLYRTIFLTIHIYDNRHWDFEENKWVIYENN